MCQTLCVCVCVGGSTGETKINKKHSLPSGCSQFRWNRQEKKSTKLQHDMYTNRFEQSRKTVSFFPSVIKESFLEEVTFQLAHEGDTSVP